MRRDHGLGYVRIVCVTIFGQGGQCSDTVSQGKGSYSFGGTFHNSCYGKTPFFCHLKASERLLRFRKGNPLSNIAEEINRFEPLLSKMNLKFVNTKELKFTHNEQGTVARYKHTKYILGYISISHPSAHFSESDYINYAKIVIKFHCSVRNKPVHLAENLNPVKPCTDNFNQPFCKYISQETYDNYISKGKWQLGTIHQYRTIENKQQRDEFEGYSFINLNINQQILSAVVNSGFDYLIFCGTSACGAAALSKQFGTVKMRIEDVKGFADCICKIVHAKNYMVQKVEYNTLKLYVNPQPIQIADFRTDHFLTPSFFEVIRPHAMYPSLFVKPEPFAEEDEVRIVFEMNRLQHTPFRFESQELLKYVSFEQVS